MNPVIDRPRPFKKWTPQIIEAMSSTIWMTQKQISDACGFSAASAIRNLYKQRKIRRRGQGQGAEYRLVRA